eukprot:13649596-Alexandrium_andersonii.AAC.1
MLRVAWCSVRLTVRCPSAPVSHTSPGRQVWTRAMSVLACFTGGAAHATPHLVPFGSRPKRARPTHFGCRPTGHR